MAAPLTELQKTQLYQKFDQEVKKLKSLKPDAEWTKLLGIVKCHYVKLQSICISAFGATRSELCQCLIWSMQTTPIAHCSTMNGDVTFFRRSMQTTRWLAQ